MTQFYDRQSLSKYDDTLDTQNKATAGPGFWQDLTVQDWWNGIVEYFEKRIHMKSKLKVRRGRM